MSTKPNELQPFTFSNGITVMTRQVSIMLTMDLHRQFPPPKPPRQQVELPGGEHQWEENPADPDYLQAQQAYQTEQEERVRRLLILRGVVVTLDEEKHQQIKELRQFWKEEFGLELPGNDLMVYITYVCTGNQEDLEGLVNKILRQSQPTQEAITEAQSSFPGELQRS